MKTFIGGLVVALLVVVGALLGVTAVLAIVVGLGWVLTQVVSAFTLFEATILVIFSAVIASTIFDKLFSFFMGVDTDEYAPDEYLFEGDPENKIPVDRFSETAAEFTGEAYFRYHAANAIFDALEELPRTVGLNSEQQLVELAIRLADPVVNILRRRKKRVARVTISVGAMKKEMGRMGLRPYDDDILQTAVVSVNALLEADERLVTVVNDHEWDEFLLS